MNSFPGQTLLVPANDSGSADSGVPFVEKWLELLQHLITGFQLAYIELYGNAILSGSLTMTFPPNVGQTSEMVLAAQLARQSGAPVTGAGRMTSKGSLTLRIACPLHLKHDIEGVVVIEVNAPSSDQPLILKKLEWAETWLGFAFGPSVTGTSSAFLGNIVDAGCSYEKFDDSKVAVLAELAAQVDCTRVIFGRMVDDKLMLESVSGVSHPDPRSARLRAARQVMQQAVDVARSLSWPNASSKPTAQTLRKFAESNQLAGACVVPLVQGFRSPMVFLFEYADSGHWNDNIEKKCNDASRMAAPLLAWKHDRDRPWWRRFFSICREGLELLAGAGKRKHLLATSVFLGFLFLALGQTDYRVSASAVVEGAIQRAVVAPYDGFLADAMVRAGQTVTSGELLARLDDRELQEKRRRLQAEVAELSRQHRQAIATLNRSEASIINAQIEQANARLQLLEDQLQRIELRAPFDGRVIAGDWSRSLGMPVSRGDVIFEIAPLDAYRIVLEVSDRDIADLAADQSGEVILSALPHQPIPVTLTRITALASNDSTEPTFRVEAEPAEIPETLRPGMEGLAKVSVGERRRWWVWTHALTDWLRLQLWRWLP